MRRLFWLALGVTIGALVVRRLSRIAERMTPKGMAGSLGGALADLVDELKGFTVDVRDSMRQREADLRTGTGLENGRRR